MAGQEVNTHRWDVVVVGAGPAGCAAAAAVIQQRPSTRLLMLDRADFPRDKVCGDGIAAEVGDVLETLGFDLRKVFAGAPPVHRLRLNSPGGASVERALQRPVHVVPREIFDARLVADLRGRRVELRRHRARVIEQDADGVVIDDAIRARVVIGADGAQSVTRRSVDPFAQRVGTVALAIRGYAPVPRWQGDEQVITMTTQHWPAYAWSFPSGDGWANVGYGQLLGAGADVPTRAHLLARMSDLLPELDAPGNLRAHRLPLSSGRPPIRAGHIVLAGDAQSLINPLTGEGIFYAVESGGLAGRAAAEALGGRIDAGTAFARLMRRYLGRHFRHTDLLARLGGRPTLIDAGVRAAARDQRAFDDLVHLGLANGLITARLLTRLRFRR